jgi:hypothetical protein
VPAAYCSAIATETKQSDRLHLKRECCC